MPKGLSEFSNQIILATIVIIGLCGFIVLNLVIYYYKRKKHYQQQEILKNEFSKTLLQTQLEIQEQTLQHISHELHDNLGQVASIIKINLNTIRLENEIKAREKIEFTKELTRQLISDIKSLSVSLGSDRISQIGFIAALEMEVERINKTEQFTAKLIHEGNMPLLDKDTSLILYRISQEILNNCLKHSKARHITVKLTIVDKLLILAISDDGIGFILPEKPNSVGAGLNNLQIRASQIGAKLLIHPIPGKGTHISIELSL